MLHCIVFGREIKVGVSLVVQEPKPYILVNLVLSDKVFSSVDSGSLGHA